MIELLQLLSILLVAGYIVIVFQALWLYKILRSKAWGFLASAWVLTCGLRFWNFVRLPYQLSKLQAEGKDIWQLLTWEVWTQVAIGYAVIGLTVLGLHFLRMSLEFRLRKVPLI